MSASGNATETDKNIELLHSSPEHILSIGPDQTSDQNQSTDIEAVLGREIEPIVGTARAPVVARQIAGVVHRLEIFSGPLPPPAQLNAYEKIFPGSAARLMAMAEKEQLNRHAMQALHANQHARAERLGLWIALVFGITLILGACVCAYFRQVEIGCALVGAFGLSGLVAFIKGRSVKESQEKLNRAVAEGQKNRTHPSPAKKRIKKRR